MQFSGKCCSHARYAVPFASNQAGRICMPKTGAVVESAVLIAATAVQRGSTKCSPFPFH